MLVDRAWRQTEGSGDAGGGQALGRQGQALALAIRQGVDGSGGERLRAHEASTVRVWLCGQPATSRRRIYGP
ncbi:hypothetical protein D3C87_320950 [compost metagenome]